MSWLGTVVQGIGAVAGLVGAAGQAIKAAGSFVVNGAPPIDDSRAKLAADKARQKAVYEQLKRDAARQLPDERTPAETPTARRSRPPGEL